MNKLVLIVCFLSMLHFSSSDFENCLVKEESGDVYYNHPPTRYTFRNCTNNSYCCDGGCCSILWYTGPLAICVIITFVCCFTCLKACWDAYQDNINSEYSTENSRVQCHINRNLDQIDQILPSPPPSYNVAIFLPQPQARDMIPSYEEAVGEP